MVSSIGNTSSIVTADGLPLMDSTAGESMDSFAQQLATTLAGYLNQSGGSGIDIQIQRQNSDANQFTITVETPASTTSAAATTSSTPETAAAASTTPTTTTSTTTSGATPASSAATATSGLDKSQMTPDQAYWAEQPPAVQALQSMPADQRYAAAQDLASQGYTIDVPIMVWGWDPLATMMVRQNDGLTWVPSALQPNIPVAPGDSFAGLPSYDPNNPPAGSIPVTTAFAVGTNGIDPWIPSTEIPTS
jgi:hypothetical protein